MSKRLHPSFLLDAIRNLLSARSTRADELDDDAEFVLRLREELRSLREVPECQLSVERLRDAVFREEMVARQRRVIWPAYAAPVAGAALVVAFWWSQRESVTPTISQLSNPTTVAAQATPRAVRSDAPASLLLESASKSVSESAEETVAPPPVQVASHTPKRRSGAVRTPRRVRPAEVMIVRYVPVPQTPVAAEPAMTTIASYTPSEQTEAVADESPVVIIEASADSETGARPATELEAAQHVVISG